jgi:cytochrome c biogenesis protein CcmG/thiol:disulfide interchange protein DsbE
MPESPWQKSGKRRVIIFCIVSLVNVGLLIVLVTQLLTPTPHAATDPLIGHPAPNFSLALLEPSGGQTTLSLADLKGKSIVLNFWASWCAPCKEELPLLEQTWKQEQGKTLMFLGMDFQESGSDAASFLQHYAITYPIVLDTNGDAALKYNVTALPQTIFINRNGTVVSRVPGELTSKTLSNGLQLIR